MSGFEKLKIRFQSKQKFFSLLTSKYISGKEHEYALKVCNTFEMWKMIFLDDIICIIMLYLNFFERMDSNGQNLKSLI